MTDNSQQDKEPLFPQQKGLGWLPDYPDLRDYRVGGESIQQEDEKLQEQTAERFNHIVEVLSGIARTKEQRDAVAALKQKLLSDIDFFKVRIYNSLREGVKPKTPFASEDFFFESDLSKRILEIKNHLYILFQCADRESQISQKEDESQRSEKREVSATEASNALEILRSPAAAMEWLNKDEFKPHDAYLVKLFQYCTGEIVVDGIVGLETYTALNTYLHYFSKNDSEEKVQQFIKKYNGFYDEFKEGSDIIRGLSPTYYPSGYKPGVKLLSVPLVIPNEIIDVILDEFKGWASLQISTQRSLDDIREITFLRGIKISNTEKFAELFEDALEKIGIDIDNKNAPTEEGALKETRIDNENAKKFINELCKQFFKEDSFSQVFRGSFAIVEPIVSIIVKLTFPLTKYNDYRLEDVARIALREFARVFEEGIQSQSGLKLPELRLQPITKDIDQDLLKAALQQVRISIELEIEYKIRDFDEGKEDSSTESATLLFYYLLLKVTSYFLKIDQPDENRKPNLFSKKELFELIEENSDCSKSFFRVPHLDIPVDTWLIEESQMRKSKEKAEEQPREKTEKQFFFLPGVVDLSYWCSEIEDQGKLNSCTAFAGVALFEYFMNRATGRYTDISPLFLYKATRDLMKISGDMGASVRETMKAMALFGVPPEEFWKYDQDRVNNEPPSFCYSYAKSYQSLKYFRLDYAGISKEVLLFQIKAVVAAGFPCVFGFSAYTSALEARNYKQGIIPFPNYKRDRLLGGHSVVAIGYDDYKRIDRLDREEPSVGAFLIRNSFGQDWGIDGYGWIPYDYVLAGLTADWWSMLKAEWFNNDRFWQAPGTGDGWTPTP